MPLSGSVTAGSAALASQYNNLRDDVLNVSTGHTHTGASENGAKVHGSALASTGATNGQVLAADGSGGAAFTTLAQSGAVSFSTATAAFSTASGVPTAYQTGAANQATLVVGSGGSVFMTITNNNNYSSASRIYRTWTLGTGGASYIATQTVAPVVAGSVICDIVGGAGFQAGTTFVVKENYGSGGTWTVYLRKFTSALTNSWNTTIATFSFTGNMGETIGPFGSYEGTGGIEWVQSLGIWYGGDYRPIGFSTATTGGAGTVSMWIANDASGSVYSAPFSTATAGALAAISASVFVPATGTATGGTIYAWGVQPNANNRYDFRRVAYSVGSASISAVSTAIKPQEIPWENHNSSGVLPNWAIWDTTRSQIVLGFNGAIMGLDRTAGTILWSTKGNTTQLANAFANQSRYLGVNAEVAPTQFFDLTTGYFTSNYSGRAVLAKMGTPGEGMYPTGLVQSNNWNQQFAGVPLAGAGSATSFLFSETGGGTVYSMQIAGVANLTLAGTSSANNRTIILNSFTNWQYPGQIITVDGGANAVDLRQTNGTAMDDYLLNSVSQMAIVPGSVTYTGLAVQTLGTGRTAYTAPGTATYQTLAGTASVRVTTITQS
jgi:hypothetical protein